MKQDLKSMGESLKKKRLEKNLTLREVQNGTSIQLSHLEAIEAGDMNKLISPVYAQGFLKQYAKYLGMDGDQMVRENAEIFHVKEKQVFDYGIGTVEKRGSPGSGVKSIPSLIWIVTFGAILIAAWVAARYLELL